MGLMERLIEKINKFMHRACDYMEEKLSLPFSVVAGIFTPWSWFYLKFTRKGKESMKLAMRHGYAIIDFEIRGV